MNTILVWLAILQTHDGQMMQIDNIANQIDCDRIVQRFEHSNRQLRQSKNLYATGICTQYHKLVPVESVTVQPAQANVQVRPTVIIKKD